MQSIGAVVNQVFKSIYSFTLLTAIRTGLGASRNLVWWWRSWVLIVLIVLIVLLIVLVVIVVSVWVVISRAHILLLHWYRVWSIPGWWSISHGHYYNVNK